MPVFAFEAVDTTGKKLRREVEAGNKADALQKIRAMGLRPTKLTEKKGGGGEKKAAGGTEKKKGGGFKLFGGVSQQALTQFTAQLATLQDAGLPIVRSLKILAQQMDPGTFQTQVEQVTESVEGGSTFSEALQAYPKTFDNLFIAMVRAGEAGGVLDVILNRLSDFMEKSLRLKKKVKGAMIYPIAVITVATLILAGIMTFVIPQFEQMFADIGQGLPWMTQILLSVADIVKGYFWALPLVIFVFWFGLKQMEKSDKGGLALDKFKLKAPVFGQIVKKSTISRFCRTLGTLISSGVPILEALSIVQSAVGNRVIADAIGDVHGSIREGETIAEPLAASGVFDPLLVNMIDIGEETGELDKMLNKIADNYDTDVDVLVDSLSSLLEPVMIVGMGGAVGFIVVALFMPLVSIIQTL